MSCGLPAAFLHWPGIFRGKTFPCVFCSASFRGFLKWEIPQNSEASFGGRFDGVLLASCITSPLAWSLLKGSYCIIKEGTRPVFLVAHTNHNLRAFEFHDISCISDASVVFVSGSSNFLKENPGVDEPNKHIKMQSSCEFFCPRHIHLTIPGSIGRSFTMDPHTKRGSKGDTPLGWGSP